MSSESSLRQELERLEIELQSAPTTGETKRIKAEIAEVEGQLDELEREKEGV